MWEELWFAEEGCKEGCGFWTAEGIDEGEDLGVKGLVGGVADGADADERDAGVFGRLLDDGIFHVDGQRACLLEEGGLVPGGGDDGVAGVDVAEMERQVGFGEEGWCIDDDVAGIEAGVECAGEAGHDDVCCLSGDRELRE